MQTQPPGVPTSIIPPGLTPSPQVLRLYMFRCTVCACRWFEFGEESMFTQHCGQHIESVDHYRVQVDPTKRV